VTFWRFIHLLALFWMMAGIGATVIPIWKAWFTNEVEQRALMLVDAQRNETVWLLPGVLAAGFSGYAWAAAEDLNLVRIGWLLALQLVMGLNVFIFIPLMGVGLRRVRFLALAARKQGAITDELRSAMADNVPLVFGTLIVLTIPVMLWLPVFKPF
jgi:hypothetical protein